MDVLCLTVRRARRPRRKPPMEVATVAARFILPGSRQPHGVELVLRFDGLTFIYGGKKDKADRREEMA